MELFTVVIQTSPRGHCPGHASDDQPYPQTLNLEPETLLLGFSLLPPLLPLPSKGAIEMAATRGSYEGKRRLAAQGNNQSETILGPCRPKCPVNSRVYTLGTQVATRLLSTYKIGTGTLWVALKDRLAESTVAAATKSASISLATPFRPPETMKGG